MGASIFKRGNAYRARLRYKGLKDLCITFKDFETALEWIETHEERYLEDPDFYHEWLDKNRKSLKNKGIFHKHVPQNKS